MFLAPPTQFRGRKHLLGTQQVERAGVLFRVTGPERALVEGFRRRHWPADSKSWWRRRVDSRCWT